MANLHTKLKSSILFSRILMLICNGLKSPIVTEIPQVHLALDFNLGNFSRDDF